MTLDDAIIVDRREWEKMTKEEIIADERYHTCKRCKYGNTPFDDYPCNECVRGFDYRQDFWELEESEVEDE